MRVHARWIAGLVCGVTALALAWLVIRGGARRTPRLTSYRGDPTRWPGERALLSAPAVRFPPNFGQVRVLIDPGHGAPGNPGNRSCYCVDEQDAMLEVAEALRDRLEATGHVETRLSRERGAQVAYPARLDDAATWNADAFVSLHSDVRGPIEHWTPTPGQSCAVARNAPGFSVLYSDEGDRWLVTRRLSLGRAVARRMAEAGFLPYGGTDYLGLYEADGGMPGVFVDRHAPERRIFVLRRSVMPAVLLETHNALDPQEASRWQAPETLDAFAAAVAAALADVFGHEPLERSPVEGVPARKGCATEAD